MNNLFDKMLVGVIMILFSCNLCWRFQRRLHVSVAVVYYYAVRLFGWMFYNYNNIL